VRCGADQPERESASDRNTASKALLSVRLSVCVGLGQARPVWGSAECPRAWWFVCEVCVSWSERDRYIYRAGLMFMCVCRVNLVQNDLRTVMSS